jgi:Protein of unknown function (DUF3826)
MKKLILLTTAALFSGAAFAADTNLTPAEAEANYTKVINGRADDILKILSLSDTNLAADVHSAIVAQYRALNAWHEANDVKLKLAKSDTNAVAQYRASLKMLHDRFLAKLSADLTPDQIEKIKDKMTYGKVQFTYAGYLAQYPNLTAEQEEKILELLKEAREEAMDGGSSEEKTAVFQRYKGKINNYLSKQGIHPEKKTKPATNEIAQ